VSGFILYKAHHSKNFIARPSSVLSRRSLETEEFKPRKKRAVLNPEDDEDKENCNINTNKMPLKQVNKQKQLCIEFSLDCMDYKCALLAVDMADAVLEQPEDYNLQDLHTNFQS
jgi:hypothetical protein